MSISTMNAQMIKTCFLSGAAMLESKKEWINELNVFPVPDGDTGTNMTLTIASAVKEVEAIEQVEMATICKAISSGSLRGARGNSGVILSQLLRGFTKVVREKESIDAATLAQAFDKAVETAYKAVMKPKEGTILTVARGMADKILELAPTTPDLGVLLDKVIVYGDEVLDYTPELLPVLKQAGVVDSGGQGLMQFMKGAYQALMGNPVVACDEEAGENSKTKFTYSVELVVKLEKEYDSRRENRLKNFLEGAGGEYSVTVNSEVVKISMQADHPGLIMEEAQRLGSLVVINVTNLKETYEETVAEAAPAKEEPVVENKKYGFISVSAGAGLTEIFKSLGVDYVIEGGQTMNPSTEDMLNAIDQVHADCVFILPNNSNIILAAQQAQSIVENKEIVVVPTKTVPQGISAMIGFMEDASPEENLEAMKEALSAVKSGSVTYAVRDTEIDDKIIKENDIMGIGDKTILSVGQDIAEVTKDLVCQLAGDDAELISIYYGSDVTEEQASALADSLGEEYPDLDIEINNGGQPIYYYLISVE